MSKCDKCNRGIKIWEMSFEVEDDFKNKFTYCRECGEAFKKEYDIKNGDSRNIDVVPVNLLKGNVSIVSDNKSTVKCDRCFKEIRPFEERFKVKDDDTVLVCCKECSLLSKEAYENIDLSNNVAIDHNFENRYAGDVVMKDGAKCVAEYRRTCKNCNKVWHSLVSREKKLAGDMGNTACQMCGSINDRQSFAQFSHNYSSEENALTKMRMCPNCNSQIYVEEIIYHKIG